MDTLPANIDVPQLLQLPKAKLREMIVALYSSRCIGHGHSPDPSVAFALWRSLMLLLGLEQETRRVLDRAASAVQTAKVGRGGWGR